MCTGLAVCESCLFWVVSEEGEDAGWEAVCLSVCLGWVS